jgi:hypothetical protein
MKIKYVNKEQIEPASALAIFKTETIYLDNSLPKLIQKFLIEHEEFHIKDYKRLSGKKENLFWCEFKAYVYAFFKQPLGGIYGIVRNIYPPRLIRFIKFYFSNNDKKIKKIVKRLENKNDKH